jgi:hypothetical protein
MPLAIAEGFGSHSSIYVGPSALTDSRSFRDRVLMRPFESGLFLSIRSRCGQFSYLEWTERRRISEQFDAAEVDEDTPNEGKMPSFLHLFVLEFNAISFCILYGLIAFCRGQM